VFRLIVAYCACQGHDQITVILFFTELLRRLAERAVLFGLESPFLLRTVSDMTQRLEGKSALITWSASNIGRADYVH
jgi:hypothetical protein